MTALLNRVGPAEVFLPRYPPSSAILIPLDLVVLRAELQAARDELKAEKQAAWSLEEENKEMKEMLEKLKAEAEEKEKEKGQHEEEEKKKAELMQRFLALDQEMNVLRQEAQEHAQVLLDSSVSLLIPCAGQGRAC